MSNSISHRPKPARERRSRRRQHRMRDGSSRSGPREDRCGTPWNPPLYSPGPVADGHPLGQAGRDVRDRAYGDPWDERPVDSSDAALVHVDDHLSTKHRQTPDSAAGKRTCVLPPTSVCTRTTRSALPVRTSLEGRPSEERSADVKSSTDACTRRKANARVRCQRSVNPSRQGSNGGIAPDSTARVSCI